MCNVLRYGEGSLLLYALGRLPSLAGRSELPRCAKAYREGPWQGMHSTVTTSVSDTSSFIAQLIGSKAVLP